MYIGKVLFPVPSSVLVWLVRGPPYVAAVNVGVDFTASKSQ